MLDQLVYTEDPLTVEEINRQLLLDDENAVIEEVPEKKDTATEDIEVPF